jgi:hypothetical protein
MSDETQQDVGDVPADPATTAGLTEGGPADEPSGNTGDDRETRRDERWRDRARTAEDRADRLTKREVLRLLAQRVADPEVALTMSGEDVGTFLTEDGDVDENAVADLAERIATEHPSLRPRTHHMDLGPKASPVQGRAASWGSVIRGR